MGGSGSDAAGAARRNPPPGFGDANPAIGARDLVFTEVADIGAAFFAGGAVRIASATVRGVSPPTSSFEADATGSILRVAILAVDVVLVESDFFFTAVFFAIVTGKAGILGGRSRLHSIPHDTRVGFGLMTQREGVYQTGIDRKRKI